MTEAPLEQAAHGHVEGLAFCSQAPAFALRLNRVPAVLPAGPAAPREPLRRPRPGAHAAMEPAPAVPHRRATARLAGPLAARPTPRDLGEIAGLIAVPQPAPPPHRRVAAMRRLPSVLGCHLSLHRRCGRCSWRARDVYAAARKPRKTRFQPFAIPLGDSNPCHAHGQSKVLPPFTATISCPRVAQSVPSCPRGVRGNPNKHRVPLLCGKWGRGLEGRSSIQTRSCEQLAGTVIPFVGFCGELRGRLGNVSPVGKIAVVEEPARYQVFPLFFLVLFLGSPGRGAAR